MEYEREKGDGAWGRGRERAQYSSRVGSPRGKVIREIEFIGVGEGVPRGESF